MASDDIMKVAFVTSFPQDPGRPAGGVEAVSINLARALAKADDLDVHIITTDRDCAATSQTAWESTTVHRLPWAGHTVLSHATGPGRRAVSAYIADLAPDVIHAHDIYGLMVQGMPIPRVFTIHGFIHADTRISGERLARLRAWIWKRIETAGWADQPHIVSISPYVRERLTGIATGRIHDIDNPIAEAFFDLPNRDGKGIIFSAALICPRKNPLTLVEALAKLQQQGVDAELRLAGTISEPAYGKRLQKRIGELGLQNNVTLLGSISAEQVRDELINASAFALVSYEEGSPMGIEEAMAAGVPVVTSDRCGMPYLVSDGATGFLVDPNDVDDVAWRLGQLLTDSGLRSDMGRESRQVALRRFHPQAVARRTQEVYERAIRDHTQGNGHAKPRR